MSRDVDPDLEDDLIVPEVVPSCDAVRDDAVGTRGVTTVLISSLNFVRVTRGASSIVAVIVRPVNIRLDPMLAVNVGADGVVMVLVAPAP